MLWNSITALLPRVFKSMYSLCVGMHFCACGRVFGTLFVFINNKVIRNCNLLAKRITAVITMARPQPQHNPTAPFQSQYQLNPRTAPSIPFIWWFQCGFIFAAWLSLRAASLSPGILDSLLCRQPASERARFRLKYLCFCYDFPALYVYIFIYFI